MKVHVLRNRADFAFDAGGLAQQLLIEALARNTSREANIIFAAAPSQNEVLEGLFEAGNIDWSRVNFFHMDEYVGLPRTHRASFRGFFEKRIPRSVLGRFKSVNWIEGDAPNLDEHIDTMNQLLEPLFIDVCFCGVGENRHLAFNDPPCRIGNVPPLIKVRLDRACREQQHAEGHFDSFDEVPETALSLSVPYLLRAKRIVCAVPGARKAAAVSSTLSSIRPTPEIPSSYLMTHPACDMYLDLDSAAETGLTVGTHEIDPG